MKVATQRRLEDYAEAVGSKAKTISGMMRAVRAHGLPQKNTTVAGQASAAQACAP